MPLSPKRGPAPAPDALCLKTSEIASELSKHKKNKKVVESMQTDMIVDTEGIEQTKLSKEERRARKAAENQLLDTEVEAEISESLSKQERRARKAAKKQVVDTELEAEISESLSKEERRARKAAKKQLVDTELEAEISESKDFEWILGGLSKEERKAQKATKKQSVDWSAKSIT